MASIKVTQHYEYEEVKMAEAMLLFFQSQGNDQQEPIVQLEGTILPPPDPCFHLMADAVNDELAGMSALFSDATGRLNLKKAGRTNLLNDSFCTRYVFATAAVRYPC